MVRPIDLAFQKLEYILKEMSIEALKSMDLLTYFKRQQTVKDLKEISDRLRKLKEEAGTLILEIIVRYQPAATDLRFVKSSLEITYDLYRISRYSYDIALALEDANLSLEECLDEDIQSNIERVKNMLNLTIKAIVKRSVELATEIKEMDQSIDEAYKEYFHKALEFKGGKCAVANLLIMRYLERIADHCSYIADEILFIIKGAK
ncbi:MAG: PhoU domain-containing protein [Thermoproteota archaeon]|jgi:Phosphate uptake regulator